ncbi:uncharacterized protein BDZ99DRAFT_209799 [Mytilinidion resinicola]|uniref:Uncharacterized protein n=1 Tax=Mytilinidion resinicola TaxID=574789 RepID=A0A6A6Y020_9PEZI|nr:uncharacterized protein BDZ99DRAFT_209799 [Mytilinidion resinicola]KAF2802112.1 hypothetical protein BDZ99DRAFT_209799 [Mytilinidion resinicola]
MPRMVKSIWASVNDASRNRKELYDTWRSIVESYTFYYPTYTSDVLAAIAGLAKYIAFRHLNSAFGSQAAKDDYLAGLWRGDLIHGLTWEMYVGSSSPGDWRQRPCVSGEAQHPSWSWVTPYPQAILYSCDCEKLYLRTPLILIHEVEVSRSKTTFLGPSEAAISILLAS